jgi:hypothetical protein
VKPYRRYPGPDSRDRIWWLIIVVALLLGLTLVVRLTTGDAKSGMSGPPTTYQGKTIRWWAARAVQARRDANARAVTVRRLRRTLRHNPGISEAIRLATIAYPAFSQERAWQIVEHESMMTPDPAHAKNPSSSASGLFQFLDSTWASTPYGKAGMSVWSPYASALAAGYLHQQGQGCVHWRIEC